MSGNYLGGGSIPTLRSYTSSELRAINPKSVVDFGAGRGLMGQLCREALGPEVRLVAVEGCQSTVPILQGSKIYDTVTHALINDWVASNRETFDLAIYGDVLEHLSRRQAFAALSRTLAFATNVIVNVPLRNLQQDAADDNPLEEHKAFFTESCFLDRYIVQEMHLLNAGHAVTNPGWEMMNCWIVGVRRKKLNRSFKHALLKFGGHRTKRVLGWLGSDPCSGPLPINLGRPRSSAVSTAGPGQKHPKR